MHAHTYAHTQTPTQTTRRLTQTQRRHANAQPRVT